MADSSEVVAGRKYAAIANDTSNLIIQHTTLGNLSLDEAISVIVSVVADYARGNYEDPAEALCSIIHDRMNRPLPEMLPIGPGGSV